MLRGAQLRLYECPMTIELLLVRHGEQRPVLSQSLPPIAASSGAVQREALVDGVLRDDLSDPQDLVKQGWGIVITDDEHGSRLLSAVEELCNARKEQQGRNIKVYCVPAGMNAERAALWKRQVYWDAKVRPEERPRYLLILGDLDGVSLEFQQIVGADVFVGRLAFPDTDGFSAYARKVVLWEKEPSTEKLGRALFYTVNDGTAATTTAARRLVSPLMATSQESQRNGYLRAAEMTSIPYEGGANDPISLLVSRLAQLSPSLFFSVSHGLGPPRGGFDSAHERRALQGAMCFENGKTLSGNDLAGQSFLPGGVWFMLSCYGGATPSTSAYHRWLKELRQNDAYRDSVDVVLEGLPRAGERPFVAALPQTLLANPRGPLAVIAHADLAWSCSFEEWGVKQGHSERFSGLVTGIVNAQRVGTAFHDLYRFLGETNTELLTRYDLDEAPDNPDWRIERSRLWMQRNDLAGYMLLGDPAVRLPLAGTRDNGASKKTESLSTTERARRFVVMGSSGKSTLPAPIDQEKRERAVIAVLAGEDVDSVARRLQLSRDDVGYWAKVYRDAGRAALRGVK